jgi:hypothetical protein
MEHMPEQQKKRPVKSAILRRAQQHSEPARRGAAWTDE